MDTCQKAASNNGYEEKNIKTGLWKVEEGNFF